MGSDGVNSFISCWGDGSITKTVRAETHLVVETQRTQTEGSHALQAWRSGPVCCLGREGSRCCSYSMVVQPLRVPFLFKGNAFISSVNQPLSQAFEVGKSLGSDRLVVRACLRMSECHRNTLL